MNKNIRLAKQLLKIATQLLVTQEKNKTKLQQQYKSKKSQLMDEIKDYIINYVTNDFGAIQDDGYIITFEDWCFEIQCGDKQIDEDKVRKLIRVGEANKKLNKILEDAWYDALDYFELKLNKLVDLNKEAYGYTSNCSEQLNSILDECDITPGKSVKIYKNGKYTGMIPWTRSMWGNDIFG